MTVAAKPKGLYAKMAEVLGEIEKVPKRGHAEVQTKSGSSYSYDYITESDLMTALRPELTKRGIAVFYSDEIRHREDNLVSVRVYLKFVDGETGEHETVHGDGDGTDMGDKAANKAKTSALRYLLWKMTLTPSDQDPEQENVERKALGRSLSEGGRSEAAQPMGTGPNEPVASPSESDLPFALQSPLATKAEIEAVRQLALDHGKDVEKFDIRVSQGDITTDWLRKTREKIVTPSTSFEAPAGVAK